VRAAVLGSPIKHSLSPVLHRSAYRALGLDWTYSAHEVDEEELPAFLARLRTAPDSWAGLSLTMPLKEVVLPLLDDVTDQARLVGAVNTVVVGRQEDLTWLRGSNTDIEGMSRTIAELSPGPFDNVIVLGGGASARSALAALATVTANMSVTVCCRSAYRSTALRQLASALGLRLSFCSWADVTESSGVSRIAGAPLVINTTPVGATDQLARALTELRRPPENAGSLFDIVYRPWPTPLAASWLTLGGVAIGGLELLIRQAALQVTAMTGEVAPLAAMREASE
jgi:shikimate dehydrogenase